MHERRSGDGFVRCSDGHVRWGIFGAAGVVFTAPGDGGGEPVALLQLRSAWSHEGGTWSCPGGALEAGETALEGALREAAEEVGTVPAPWRLVGQHVFAPAIEWSYTTVIVAVAHPFGAALNFETEAVDWAPISGVERRALHPGFAAAWPHVRAIIEADADRADEVAAPGHG